MNRIGFGFVIGVILALAGASIALELIFSVTIPLVRAAIAIFLLVVGARLAMRAWVRDRAPASGEAWLADRKFAPTGPIIRDARYDVVFGRGLIDLTGLTVPEHDVTITVDTLFGATVVKVDPAIGYDVDGSSAFGEVRMPDRSATAMGNLHYPASTAEPARLHVKVNAVFGACQVVEASAAAA